MLNNQQYGYEHDWLGFGMTMLELYTFGTKPVDAIGLWNGAKTNLPKVEQWIAGLHNLCGQRLDWKHFFNSVLNLNLEARAKTYEEVTGMLFFTFEFMALDFERVKQRGCINAPSPNHKQSHRRLSRRISILRFHADPTITSVT
jgi:hypothetical protein